MHCTQKLTDSISLLSGVRGSSKEMFGYAVPNNYRSTICRNDYRFLGVRIQIMLKKTTGKPRHEQSAVESQASVLD